MATINPGYMGWASFGGNQFRFTDCSVSAKQAVDAPDLITGYWRRMAYNYGKIEVNGTISGPVTESFSAAGTGMWDKATNRLSCGELEEGELAIHYFCASGGETSDFSWPYSRVNSITFSCAAGDVAQFSMDMIAAGAADTGSSTGTTTLPIEKLLTWDQVTLNVTPGDGGGSWGTPYFSNFEVTFANNVEAQYAMGSATSTTGLYPFALVDGLTTITGSVTAYNIPEMFGVKFWSDYTATALGTIVFDVGSGPQTLNVRWHRVEPTASVGPIMSTIAFTGIGPQSMD